MISNIYIYMNNKKYYNYQMTFPIESHKIHKSKSLKKVVKKCYNEYKKITDLNEGIFCITNLDKDIEYKFKVKKNKNSKSSLSLKKQVGGIVNMNEEIKEIAELDGGPQGFEDPKIAENNKQLQIVNNKLDSLIKLSDLKEKQLLNLSTQIQKIQNIIPQEIVKEEIKIIEKPNQHEIKIIEKPKEFGREEIEIMENPKKGIEEIKIIDNSKKSNKEEIEIIENPKKDIEEIKIIKNEKEMLDPNIEPEMTDVFSNVNVYDVNLRRLDSLNRIMKLDQNNCIII